MKITHDYFLSEFAKFREILCSQSYSIEDKQLALGGLMFVYARVEDGNAELEAIRTSAMDMLSVEVPRRLALEIR